VVEPWSASSLAICGDGQAYAYYSGLEKASLHRRRMVEVDERIEHAEEYG
jgi:hypothetical protein